MHLYFNMVSLLYKGTFLERKFGTPYYVYLTTVFTALTGATYVGLGALLSETLQEESYLTSCAVGFSGVLFAMKVLTTYYSPSNRRYYALGFIPVPSKYIFWAELILIQMIAPNASFVGHLAGILVGLAYVKGPLKFFMDIFFQPGNHWRQRNSSSNGEEDQGFFSSGFGRQRHDPYGSGYSGQRFHQGGQYNTGWASAAPSTPTYQRYGTAMPSAPEMGPDDIGFEGYSNNNFAPSQNPAYDRFTGGFDEDEQYRRAMDESLRYSGANNSPPGMYPNLDDLRSRRSNFYQ
ncbi:rhomboid-related protein [Plakobranchus ocellatus]|uniref:Rhomboid-related protein n=1 Tax=Plakobranchus ocellatus TaxID=259542 RepID=A0AAV3Y0D3_9GAST|nr:rhomboid-related protein [Plakobranchus ocellatus]